MSCISTACHYYIDHFLVMYDIESGINITIEDTCQFKSYVPTQCAKLICVNSIL
jgi:hypothetical protein